MEAHTLPSLILSIDRHIQVKELHLQHLRSIQHKSQIQGIPPLPKTLPKCVPPPSPKAIRHVRMVLQKWKTKSNYGSKLNQIDKTRKGHPLNRTHGKEHSVSIQTRMFHKQDSQSEEKDLKLVAQVHGLRSNSPGAARKLRSIRRREYLNQTKTSRDADFKKKRAVLPPHPQLESSCKSFVSCMSPRIPNAEEYIERSNLINPWTVHEKFYFLRLYMQLGKDFQNIARHLTYKSTHDCVWLYYTQKLHLGISSLKKKKANGINISDEELMFIAARGVLKRGVRHDE